MILDCVGCRNKRGCTSAVPRILGDRRIVGCEDVFRQGLDSCLKTFDDACVAFKGLERVIFPPVHPAFRTVNSEDHLRMLVEIGIVVDRRWIAIARNYVRYAVDPDRVFRLGFVWEGASGGEKGGW